MNIVANGEDIDNWSLDELKEIVTNFVDSQSERNLSEDPKSAIYRESEIISNLIGAAAYEELKGPTGSLFEDNENSKNQLEKPSEVQDEISTKHSEDTKKVGGDKGLRKEEEKEKAKQYEKLMGAYESKEVVDNMKARLTNLHNKLEEELNNKEEEPSIVDMISKFLKKNTKAKFDINGISVLSPNSSEYKEILTNDILDNDMLTTEINVQIKEAKVVEGGFFSIASVEYEINTQPYGWTVWRTYQDCFNLRKLLRKYYPAIIAPSLSKKYNKDSIDIPWIQKASEELQVFFDELRKDPVLRSSEAMYCFLSINDKNLYKKKIKTLLGGPDWHELHSIPNVNGKANIEMTQEIADDVDNWLEFVEVGKGLYEHLIKAFQETNKMAQALAKRIQKNSEIFNTFASTYEKVKRSDMVYMFGRLRRITNYLGKLYELQGNVINKEFCQFFERSQEEFEAIKEITDLVKAAKDKFIHEQNLLYNLKESLFKEKNASQWGVSPEVLEQQTDIKTDKSIAFPLMLPKVIHNIIIGND